MTGRDLIIYILENNLEDVHLLNSNVCTTAEDAAVKLGVGVSTIKAWYDTGMLAGIMIRDTLYVLVSGPIVLSRN